MHTRLMKRMAKARRRSAGVVTLAKSCATSTSWRRTSVWRANSGSGDWSGGIGLLSRETSPIRLLRQGCVRLPRFFEADLCGIAAALGIDDRYARDAFAIRRVQHRLESIEVAEQL